ncbi:MAG: ABC transporter permease [Geminicoccaceae bacterium]
MRAPRGLTAYALAYLVFLYLPVLLLPLFSFNDSSVVAFPLQGFTTRWYQNLVAIPALHQAVLNSLIVGIASAIVATILGIGAARAMTRYEFAGRGAVSAFLMVPMVMPEIIVAVALLVILLQLGFELSLFTITMGHVLFCLPFAISVLRTSFQGLDRSLEEASLDLGETRLMTFRRVILPLVGPGVISSLLICFTISFDEFILAFFLGGQATTLPLYIWSQLRFAAKLPNVLALGSLILLFSLFLLGTAELLRRRAERRAGVAPEPTA